MSLATACSSCSSSTAAISRRSALLPAQRCGFAAAGRQRRQHVAASLDSATVTAVTQQAVAFVAVLGGEAAFTGLTTDASTPGRPTVPATMGGVLGTLLAAVLVQQEGAVGTAGCVVGALAGAAMLSVMIQRVQKTPYNPEDWPGAKAWPATMGLISFFSLNVFFQALRMALE
ncbi:PTS system fructose-specific EIIABC [Chlorella sorokiniana]|uniref:PTS system fructose-specific EIIABC n=1 Tax=Chlorella sorokiniana TaxID=3076 RepID=A0A2P6TP62_CHLSO|nr:PTS system fructose-specific EIIABC [Chlorella sorokiniana]|eukprot:PRW51126.1 PTS system fructose-specific EIIABC [Chlorella sorokiniana]